MSFLQGCWLRHTSTSTCSHQNISTYLRCKLPGTMHLAQPLRYNTVRTYLTDLCINAYIVLNTGVYNTQSLSKVKCKRRVIPKAPAGNHKLDQAERSARHIMCHPQALTSGPASTPTWRVNSKTTRSGERWRLYPGARSTASPTHGTSATRRTLSSTMR